MSKIIKHDFKNKTVHDLGTCNYAEITQRVENILVASMYHKTETNFSITYYDNLQQDYITINMTFDGGK